MIIIGSGSTRRGEGRRRVNTLIIAGSGFIHVIRGKEGDSGLSSCLSIVE